MYPDPTTTNQNWKPVVGYEGLYEVSDLGGIRRRKPAQGTQIGRILKPSIDHKGYLFVILYHDGKRSPEKVHRLVARAFLGPCPTDHETNHLNGVKTENHVSNLEWATKSQNCRHAFALGLNAPLRGEAHPNAKLTSIDVGVIRSRRGKETQRVLAQRFGVSQRAIHDIQVGRLRRYG